MALTKAEIVGRICGKNRISNPETFNVVQATFEVIKASLERGEKVKIKTSGILLSVPNVGAEGAIPKPAKK